LVNDCPETREEAAYINIGFCQQGGGNNNGWSNQPRPPFQGNSDFNSIYNSNQRSLRDLVLGQVKINENLNKKLMSSDKILKNINSQLENLSSAIKNQLSFNKMIETQIAQVAAAMLDNGETLRQLKNSFDNVKAVTTRGGKTTHDPPHSNHEAERQPR
jgi:hypothetical protein